MSRQEIPCLSGSANTAFCMSDGPPTQRDASCDRAAIPAKPVGTVLALLPRGGSEPIARLMAHR
jgi:hypothetical protein